MKRIFLLLFVIGIVSNAKMINAVAMSVNGLAITTAEIKAVSKQYHVDKKTAQEMLILDRVQQSVLKNITVDESQVQERLNMIAAQNNISVQKMKKILKTQGVSWEKYKKKIENSIKKQKLFAQQIAPNIAPPSQQKLKQIYKNNQALLKVPSVITVIEYSSKDRDKLLKALKDKSFKSVKSKKKKLYTKKLDKSMNRMLVSLGIGRYSEVLSNGNEYIVYKVISKSGSRIMSFDEASSMLNGIYMQEQQEKLLKEYFAKEKLKAKIKKLR